MKAEKSTKDCAEYNTTNAAAIEAGLMEAIEPSERILRHEAEALAAQQKEQVEAVKMTAAAAKLGSTDGKTINGVAFCFEKIYTGGSRFSMGYHTGWKVIVGSRYNSDNRRWAVVGTGNDLSKITDKQIAKVAEKVAELSVKFDAKRQAEIARQERDARYKVWIAVESNAALLKRMTGSDYISTYGTDGFAVSEDGMLTYRYDTFTFEQWQKVCSLREAHALEMKNLKEMYRKQNTPVTVPAAQ